MVDWAQSTNCLHYHHHGEVCPRTEPNIVDRASRVGDLRLLAAAGVTVLAVVKVCVTVLAVVKMFRAQSNNDTLIDLNESTFTCHLVPVLGHRIYCGIYTDLLQNLHRFIARFAIDFPVLTHAFCSSDI